MVVDPAESLDSTGASAAELRRLLDATDEGIFRLDERGICVFVNRAAAEVLGYQPAQLLGRAMHHSIHARRPDGAPYPARECPISFTLSAGIPGRCDDEVFWRADGTPIPVEYSSAPIRAGERIVGAVVTFRDISARRQAELEHRRLLGELQVQQGRLRAILEQMPGGVMIVDAHSGRLILHNEQAAALLRQPLADALLGDLRQAWQAVGADGQPLAPGDWPLTRALLDGVVVRDQELRLRRSDGSLCWFSSSAAPVRDGQGNIVAAVLVFHDIEVRKQGEERLRFLSLVSEVLAGSLDYEVTLRKVANLAVPVAADWCFVDLLDDGEVYRVAVATAEPGQEQIADQFQRRHRPRPGACHGIALVMRTGLPELVPVVDDDYLRAIAGDDAHLRDMRALRITSTICVPLIARGRTLGTLTLTTSVSQRRYGESDLRFAEDLARRAATAIDNAQLYRESEEHVNRLNALVEISRAVAEAGLDLPRALATVVEQAAELVRDGCVLRLLDDSGEWLQTQASYHVSPGLRGPLAAVTATPVSAHRGLHGSVLAERRALLVPALAPEHYAAVEANFTPYSERGGLHSLLIAPLRIRDRVIGTLSVMRDQTPTPFADADQVFVQELADRAALAIENARLYAEAQDALRAREEFLSIASHELRTPLTTVKGYGQMLVRQLRRPDASLDAAARSAAQLAGHVTRLEELVTDLLDVSRLQQGQLALRPEPCDLSALAREVVDRFSGPEQRATDLHFVVDAPAPVLGEWDAGRLDQVLTNLLSNAVKYSPEGGMIRVGVSENSDGAQLTVSDEGIGIDPAYHARLFQPFSRVGDGARAAGGTGLGLYICRQIVERHGGELAVVSEKGKGSTFVVRLPRTPVVGSVP